MEPPALQLGTLAYMRLGGDASRDFVQKKIEKLLERSADVGLCVGAGGRLKEGTALLLRSSDCLYLRGDTPGAKADEYLRVSCTLTRARPPVPVVLCAHKISCMHTKTK